MEAHSVSQYWVKTQATSVNRLHKNRTVPLWKNTFLNRSSTNQLCSSDTVRKTTSSFNKASVRLCHLILSSMMENLRINMFDPVSFCFMSHRSSSFVLCPRHFVIIQTSTPSSTPHVCLSHACEHRRVLLTCLILTSSDVRENIHASTSIYSAHLRHT